MSTYNSYYSCAYYYCYPAIASPAIAVPATAPTTLAATAAIALTLAPALAADAVLVSAPHLPQLTHLTQIVDNFAVLLPLQLSQSPQTSQSLLLRCLPALAILTIMIIT
jgi:hypothetical protein